MPATEKWLVSCLWLGVQTDLQPRWESTVVWRSAHALVLGVYRYSGLFPRHEMYGLASQLRRAAVSVPGNFAEGYGRRSPVDKARFYNIAEASLAETRYYLRLAEDLGYGPSAELQRKAVDVSRMLAAYRRRMLECSGH